MLTIRSYRNEDPPRLLELWRRSQNRCEPFPPLIPLSLNLLQTQVLGLPLFDFRSIMIAFEGDMPVGYVHTTLAPNEECLDFDSSAGHICFLCVDPSYHDVHGAATALIRAGENYLKELGAKTIFGGSPSPSAPFYNAFYSGGEAVGILHSDSAIVQAFLRTEYQVHQRTVWFHLDLRQYTPLITPETISWYSELSVEINEIPKTKSWWEGCMLANGLWLDATAFLIQTRRPIARLRTRITYPDTEFFFSMYGGTWLASLMELRVHPDYINKGVATYLLGELLRHLIARNQIVQVEAHVAENSPLSTLLSNQLWQERDYGYVFVKNNE